MTLTSWLQHVCVGEFKKEDPTSSDIGQGSVAKTNLGKQEVKLCGSYKRLQVLKINPQGCLRWFTNGKFGLERKPIYFQVTLDPMNQKIYSLCHFSNWKYASISLRCKQKSQAGDLKFTWSSQHNVSSAPGC